MRHKHYDLILEWACGAEIECLNNGKWEKTKYPTWFEGKEYRIKPEPKTDIVLYALADDCKNNYGYLTSAWPSFEELIPNIKLIYDGVTKELKSVEKI